MNCDDIRDLFAGFIDDALSEEEKDAIRTHLASCTLCSKKLKDLRQTVTLVHNLSEVDPPHWFTQKIMSQIKQESLKRNIFDKLRDFFTVGIPIKVFASVLVAVIAIFLYRLSIPEPELIKIEHQIPLFHAEKHTNPQGKSNTLTGPGKIQPAGSNSGTKQDERAGVEPSADKSAHGPSMHGETHTGSSSLLTGTSAGSGSNKLSSTLTADQGQKGRSGTPPEIRASDHRGGKQKFGSTNDHSCWNRFDCSGPECGIPGS